MLPVSIQWLIHSQLIFTAHWVIVIFVAICFSVHSGKLNNSMRGLDFTAIYILIGRSYQYLSNYLFMVSSYSLRIELLWFLLPFVFPFTAENSITRCADHTSLLFIFKLVDLTIIYLITFSWSAHIHCALIYCDFVAICFSVYGGKLNNSMRGPYFTAIYI